MPLTQAQKDYADKRIKDCPGFAAYDAARTAADAEADPAAKRLLMISRNKLAGACMEEAGIV